MSEQPLSFVHRFVPRTPGGPAATLLLLHGTGGTEDDLLGLGRVLLPGAALLSPRGQSLENGMPRFFRRLAEGVFDLEDLERRTHELADFVREASDAYGLDPGRIIAVGYSNGANIAASTLLLRPEALAGGVLFRPMVPLVPPRLPDLSEKSVLVAGGRSDSIATASHTQGLADLLSAAGADVAMHWHSGGHELGNDDVAAAHDWLAGQSLVEGSQPA